jgi:pyridoxal phosphate enzyme (YggS family)
LSGKGDWGKIKASTSALEKAGFEYSTTIVEKIRANYQHVLEQIGAAAAGVGRDPGQVRLVVVTKGHPLETVASAIRAGARRLGENYVDEGQEKILALDADQVEWHMIGHIQSRKARAVCQYFDWVHTIDSLKLASRLDRFAAEESRILPVLLECNVSGEASKSGWAAWQDAEWGQLADALAPLFDLSNLQVHGLMTMPPFFEDPEQARPFFQRLRRLRDFLADRFPGTDWPELSMGMSADFQVAVEEGATLVRVGTAILGPRPGS